MPIDGRTGTARARARRSWLDGCLQSSVGVLCAAVCLTATAGQGVFVASDERDVIHLSDQSVGLQPVLLVPSADESGMHLPETRLPSRSDRRVASARRPDPAVDAAIDGAARQHRVSTGLIRAVIATESAFGVRAVSPRGAMGLMQLMPATARELGVTDAFDPRQNIEAGTRHLRQLLDRFGDDTALALAAYNAGAGAVERYGLRIPPFAETLAYVPRVMGHLHASPAPVRVDVSPHSP